MSEAPPQMELKIILDESGIVEIEPSESADLFSLIVMAETAHQMLMAQYFQLAAAKVQQRQKFSPKLLIPTKG